MTSRRSEGLSRRRFCRHPPRRTSPGIVLNGTGVAVTTDQDETGSGWPIEWTDRLQRLVAGLSGVVDSASAARETVEHGRAALGADSGIVMLISADGEALEIAYDTGYPREALDPWRRFPLSLNIAATEAVRTRVPVLVGSRDEM